MTESSRIDTLLQEANSASNIILQLATVNAKCECKKWEACYNFISQMRGLKSLEYGPSSLCSGSCSSRKEGGSRRKREQCNKQAKSCSLLTRIKITDIHMIS